MTYSLYVNQPKAIEWGLSVKASLLMSKMADLSSWAVPVVLKEAKEEIYYLLYRAKIEEELPLLGTLRTITRILAELEDKEIIESILKNSTPAYRLTAKGKTWLSDSKKANGGENEKERKKGYFELSYKTQYTKLKDKYKDDLKLSCEQHAKQNKIPVEQFEDFIVNAQAKGVPYKDWGKGFIHWCNNWKKWNVKKTNIGDFYSNNGKGLME